MWLRKISAGLQLALAVYLRGMMYYCIMTYEFVLCMLICEGICPPEGKLILSLPLTAGAASIEPSE